MVKSGCLFWAVSFIELKRIKKKYLYIKTTSPKWIFIAYVLLREVSSPFALSNVINEMEKFSPNLKTVKLWGKHYNISRQLETSRFVASMIGPEFTPWGVLKEY